MMKKDLRSRRLMNDQMTAEDLERINRLVADTKRFLEMYATLPYVRDEFNEDSEAFLAKHHLDVDPEEMKFLVNDEYAQERKRLDEDPDAIDLLPEAAFRFRQFLANKFAARDMMIDKYCKPSNPRMIKWRERQMNRCLAGVGGVNKAFVHCPLAIELDLGCSVGCDFCGLGAPKLQKICRYTEENAAMFRQILADAHRIIGDAAGFGTLYLATEPLDNPDYELFEGDFVKEFRFIPQITTAVADRDIERTRRLVHKLYSSAGFIHRFTLRSVEMAEKIFAEFTPMELLRVELLPMFPEAPTFVPFTVVGGQAKHVKEEDVREGDPGTICCADGFVINMAEKSIRLITPCHMTDKFPNGVAEPVKRYFESADECAKIMEEIIDEYMITDIPDEEPLRLYPYLERCETMYGDSLQSRFGGMIFALDKLSRPYAKRVIELLQDGTWNKHEIVRIVTGEYDAKPENVFWMLNQFWKQGYIYDSRLFGSIQA